MQLLDCIVIDCNDILVVLEHFNEGRDLFRLLSVLLGKRRAACACVNNAQHIKFAGSHSTRGSGSAQPALGEPSHVSKSACGVFV